MKPKALKRGDRIAIVTPSSGLPNLFPDQFEKGLKNLESFFGFEIVEMPSCRKSIRELYEHPEWRAQDINAAFLDPTIDGIISSIGGYESVRILEYLDIPMILEHPKFFMGFSDSTAYLSYLNSVGLVTFYGPSVMAGLAQLEHLPDVFLKHLREMFSGPDIPYLYKPYQQCRGNIRRKSSFEYI